MLKHARSATAVMVALGVLSLPACSSSAPSQTPSPVPSAPAEESPGESSTTVVQPGAPGESSRVVGADELDPAEMPGWTGADAEFMAAMIHHHAQALQMTALIDDRSRSRGVHQMGLRMEISQRDEIRLMQNWLEERGLEPPRVVLEQGPEQGQMAGTMEMHLMPGMLSPPQMQQLREASGDEFDRLWLQYMIQHHTGALVMVKELFEQPGAAQESLIFRFASDVDADQRAEIDRMNMLLEQYR